MYIESFIIDIESQNKNFTPPIVFLDEITTITEPRIKLLRNLCRVLGLPSVLASTSAKVMNLLNVNSASAINEKSIWVHAIRTLPPANLKGIFHLFHWNQYIELNGYLNLKMILADLNIQYEDTEFNQLQNLVWLMIKQSETCLQGVSLIFFKALKDGLEAQRGNQLDVKIIWKQSLNFLRYKLFKRKPRAFNGIGQFHTLAMMSNYQMICENENKIKSEPGPTSDIIFETINQHFYFFGRTIDKIVIPLAYNGGSLILDAKFYEICSHFKLFHENLFFCLAMWLRDSVWLNASKVRSIASIYCEYGQKLRHLSKNIRALKNDSSAQECVIHWGLCNSTFKDFSNLNPGFPFLTRFIENIQVDELNFSGLSKKHKIDRFNGQINFDSCSNLEAFLSKIQIPQLLPCEIMTGEIRDKLKGLCLFGECNRLPDPVGIDVEFDLFFNGNPFKGFVECKYIDTNIEKSTVLDYIIKTCKRNSPFSMIVTYSMQKCLKSADSWKTEPENDLSKLYDEKFNFKRFKLDEKSKEEIKNREFKRKERNEKIKLKEKLVEDVSIYSVHYEKNGPGMVAVPLVECENPKGVFIIIQTNFVGPKI